MDKKLNINNYGEYSDVFSNGSASINTSDLRIDNLDYNIDCILNILRDGIELDKIQNAKIYVNFVDGQQIYLSVFDYYINLIMWRSILSVEEEINSSHIFFAHNTTRNEIKRYFDIHIINPYKDKISNKKLNNILADTLDEFGNVDEFSLYLANTINVEDDIRLMNESPRARELYNTSLEGVQFEDVKKVGTERANELVSLIKDTDYHALGNYFKAGEGIDSRQYREYAVSIGTKPDGQGGIFPIVVNSSYIRGGLNTPESRFVESSAGRTSQILSKTNVGDSGHFARLLGLNNSDTILHHDHTYVCDSVNFQHLFIKDSSMLKNIIDRYYRVSPNGIEKIVTENDTHLIETTIYLRSPMTCMSNARGEGICYRCYGKLAYTNADINIGKMAAEEISSRLTQRLLSAKHLLESMIEKITWSEAFNKYFILDANIIYLKQGVQINGYKMRIDPDGIDYESELDDHEYNEYINTFQVITPDGNIDEIYTEQSNDIYLSGDINDAIRKKAVAIDEMVEIDFKDLVGKSLFILQIHNNELSATLKMIKSIIDKKDVTMKLYDRHTILQALLETMREGGINVSSVHAEVILSNQVSDDTDVTNKPKWNSYDPGYQLQTLDRALKNNPSIIVSLSYEDVSRTLYNPLTYHRNGISFMDLFFMESPKRYLDNKPDIKYVGNEIIENE